MRCDKQGRLSQWRVRLSTTKKRNTGNAQSQVAQALVSYEFCLLSQMMQIRYLALLRRTRSCNTSRSKGLHCYASSKKLSAFCVQHRHCEYVKASSKSNPSSCRRLRLLAWLSNYPKSELNWWAAACTISREVCEYRTQKKNISYTPYCYLLDFSSYCWACQVQRAPFLRSVLMVLWPGAGTVPILGSVLCSHTHGMC